MNSYNVNIDGKVKTIKGCNLESALTSIGLTQIEITPNWYKISNGEYIVRCSEHLMLNCEWIEKKNKLKQRTMCNPEPKEEPAMDYWERRKHMNDLLAMDNKPYNNGQHASY